MKILKVVAILYLVFVPLPTALGYILGGPSGSELSKGLVSIGGFLGMGVGVAMLPIAALFLYASGKKQDSEREFSMWRSGAWLYLGTFAAGFFFWIFLGGARDFNFNPATDLAYLVNTGSMAGSTLMYVAVTIMDAFISVLAILLIIGKD